MNLKLMSRALGLLAFALLMAAAPAAGAQKTPSEGLLLGHAGPVWDVAWSPAGDRLASAGEDGTVRIWAQGAGGVWEAARVIQAHEGGATAVAWSPDGARLASAGKDGAVRVWDADSGAALLALEGHAGPVWDVAWSPAGDQLASAGADGTLRTWDAADGAARLVIDGHEGEVWAAAWSPDGDRLASGGLDGTVRTWEADTGAAIVALKGHAGPVWDVAWAPGGERLASGGVDGSVRTWEASTGAALATLRGHSGDVNAVAFSPPPAGETLSPYVASGSMDRTVGVWALAGIEGERVALMPNAAYVTGLAWSPAVPMPGNAQSDSALSDSAPLDAAANAGATPTQAATFSRLAGASYDGSIQVWDFFTTLQPAGDATAIPALATATPAARVVCTAVTNNNANLRAGPSTDIDVLGLAPTGTAVNVVAQNRFGDWYQVEVALEGGGNLAWIAGFLLNDLTCPEGASLPVVE